MQIPRSSRAWLKCLLRSLEKSCKFNLFSFVDKTINRVTNLNQLPSGGTTVRFDDHSDHAESGDAATWQIIHALVIVVVLVQLGHSVVLGYYIYK